MIEDADDLRRAIRAVGRSSRAPERVRMHIIKNAKRLGLTSMIPSTWNADGSLSAGRSAVTTLLPDDSDELFTRFDALEARSWSVKLRALGAETRPTVESAPWYLQCRARFRRPR